MNVKTIGCVELNSIAVGIMTADAMTKSGEVKLILSRPTCPGRYLILVAGDTAAVKSSVDTGCEMAGEMLVDWLLLSNIHEEVIPALNCTSIIPPINAVGVIETYTTAASILAADAAVKAGQISLLEIRFASGLGGKAYVTMTGDVASVKTSVAAGVKGVGNSGPVVSHVVIPSPSQDLKDQLI